ncbi:Hsp33 family molecular chaperone HslO [Anaerobium acetethylicum]|uniref:33 kDa chaperonin n=1 Tax=Anaerobium acetethylicum TaxID=1619234 RepID=A0A1D3TVV3_9FIRM|nr:Hsp33 family molecular chaperone HslO [Anaerobium acetethylicum]SCP98314.1 molecular chaperone Hsp33 [Anaerobium acetethylicum]
MSDYIVRATAGNGQIRAFAASTKELVEYARSVHNTSPVATAALGRLLTAGSIMGSMMKGDDDVLTLQIQSGGPIGGITVTADSKGNVKGYVNNPEVIIPANAQGKLDVGAAVGVGFMNIIRDMGLKEPYVSQTALQTSEIAEDLTYYFATSEQVPSSVALGVLMEKNNTVKQAGGFIIQLMPFADEAVISKLEAKLGSFTSITALLDQGFTPEMVLEEVLGEFGVDILETYPVKFHCDCSKKRVEKAIISIGKEDITEMINDGEDITVNCHFCNKNYTFSIDDLREIAEKRSK